MSRDLDPDLLRCFIAVAETRTLGRAATRIGRTQAAASMQVKKLETLIGQPLLHRGARGVTLTHHGERLLGHARALLQQHDAALAELTGAGLAGTLRFGCPDDYAAAFLPRILRGFAGRHPHAVVDVVCAPSPRLEERLRRHELDLALVSAADGAEPALRREPLVWVGLRDDDGAAREPLRLALSDPDTLDHRAACERLDAAGVAYRVAYASAGMAGLLAVVRSGQAIAVLTQSAVPADLRVLAPDSRLPALPAVGVLVRTALPRPAALVAEFVRHLHEVVSSA